MSYTFLNDGQRFLLICYVVDKHLFQCGTESSILFQCGSGSSSWSRDLMTKNGEILQVENISISWFQNWITFNSRPPWGTSKLKRRFQSSKENIQQFGSATGIIYKLAKIIISCTVLCAIPSTIQHYIWYILRAVRYRTQRHKLITPTHFITIW